MYISSGYYLHDMKQEQRHWETSWNKNRDVGIPQTESTWSNRGVPSRRCPRLPGIFAKEDDRSTCEVSICRGCPVAPKKYGGFPSHGESPIAGWFISLIIPPVHRCILWFGGTCMIAKSTSEKTPTWNISRSLKFILKEYHVKLYKHHMSLHISKYVSLKITNVHDCSFAI